MTLEADIRPMPDDFAADAFLDQGGRVSLAVKDDRGVIKLHYDRTPEMSAGCEGAYRKAIRQSAWDALELQRLGKWDMATLVGSKGQ